MPTVKTGGINTFYEINGDGYPIVFIHGGWVSHQMWKPQVDYFSAKYKVITYDIRGHGKTGGSAVRKYSMELFAEDLAVLLRELQIQKPVLCGMSMGGMLAQSYATRYPDGLKALVLCDTAASTALTLSDKITKYILAPKWLFLLLVKMLGIKKYADFAFWYAKKSRSDRWVGLNQDVAEYEKKEMLQFGVEEFNKIFAAVYDFKLQALARIKVKTLVMNGEFESRAVFRHTSKIIDLIPNARSSVIPDAGHASNLENPAAFNMALENFLESMQLIPATAGLD